MRIIVVLLFILVAAPAYSWTATDVVTQVKNRKAIIHTVQKSESVSSILKNYNLSLEKFLKANKQFIGTNLSLSLGQQLVINKKDVGSASHREIDHEIKLHLEAMGIKPQPKEEPLPAQKQELMKELNTVSKYQEPQKNGKLLPWNEVIKVTMLLPLTRNDGTEDKEFESFYKGAILAMSQLKTDGISLEVEVFDTGHSVSSVQSLISEGVLRNRNLVIGPVYKDQFSLVANCLRGRGTVLISPLSAVEGVVDGNTFQLAPSQSSRYNKLKDFFTGRNVIYCTTQNDDSLFNENIKKYSDKALSLHRVRGDKSVEELKSYFTTSAENVVVVSSKNKGEIELILSKIATLKKGFSSNYKIAVLGSSEFSKIDDTKKDDFFKSNTYFITNYHQDRLNSSALEFETQYIEMFGEQPNLFSYRAYDAVTLFVSAMYESGSDFADYPFDQMMRILQVDYRFLMENGCHVNQEWMLVNYSPDYSIIAK